MAIPLWILFIQGFATGLLTTWLGLVLVNIHPHIRKLAIVGLCYALLAMVIRSLPLHFIFHFGILTFLLIFIVQLMWDLTLLRALIAIVLGNLIMALGEVFFTCVIFKNLQYRYLYHVVTNNLYLLLVPLPQIIIVVLLIWFYIREENIYLILNKQTQIQWQIRKDKVVVVLVALMFTLIVILVVCIIANYICFPTAIILAWFPRKILD